MTTPNCDDIVIGFCDLKRLFFRCSRQLKFAALAGALVVFFYLSLKDPVYVANASFKQSNQTVESVSKLKDLFQHVGMGSSESGAASVMQSRTILRTVVERLGLQALSADQIGLMRYIHRFIDHLKIEMGKEISRPDSFCFRNVVFDGDRARTVYLKPMDALTFELYNERKELIGRANLDQPFSFGNISATLVEFPPSVRFHKWYRLTLLPWGSAVDQLRGAFSVKPFKFDRAMLELEFSHRDPVLAAQVVNEVMEAYCRFLCSENEALIGEQRKYLDLRQQELVRDWDQSLQEHVCYLKSNLGSSGYLSLHQEMEMLGAPHKQFTSKLFDVDLELKRLEGMPLDDKALALSPKTEIPLAMPSVFDEKKHDTQHHLLSIDLEHSRLNDPAVLSTLFGNELVKFKREQEFAGLTLENAQSLYLNYNTARDQLQAELRQLVYLLDELESPHFELSSITTILSDPVTLEMVGKASDMAISLRDAHNRSLREQEHLREALVNQKKFIATHLEQTIELLKLRARLIEDKILSLQKTTLKLLAQERGLIQEKLEEINDEMGDLPEKWRRENLLMLKKEMGMQMIEGLTQLAESKNIEQHLYQAASKTLDVATIPSSPKPPRLMILSLMAALLAACATYGFSLFKALIRGMPVSHETLLQCGYRSLGKLSLYCGSPISELAGCDLETLRRIAQFITSAQRRPLTAALICGKKPDYSHNLAELLAIQGAKVLVIHYVFDAAFPHQIPGFWHYLQDEVPSPPIRYLQSYDYLPCGSTSRHGVEMLHHPKFQAMLSDMKLHYDYVLLYSKALPQFAEAHALLSQVDVAIVTACEEKREDLTPFQEWETKASNAKAAFVCYEPQSIQ